MQRKPSPHCAAIVASLLVGWAQGGLADEPAPAESGRTLVFEQDVLPILTQHCLKCHGLEARKASLDLRTAGLAGRGGDSGPAIVAGDTELSLLWQRVADGSMPPEGELPLSDAKKETMRQWIAGGAQALGASDAGPTEGPPEVSESDRQFWAFQRPQKAALPAVLGMARAATPIDAFLLSRLEEKVLGFSPPAEPYTVVRRVYLDLVGLPPSPGEVEQFVSDTSNDAYEQLIDRLLASPHFGERWGRHWLDAAGYVDTVGADNDAAIIIPAEGKWRYRDYVVRSFNDDKPYDRFVTEQLAGDELAEWREAAGYTSETLDLLVATGYLRNVADRTAEDELNTADIRYSVLHDTLELIGTNLLGLTLQCARCHAHKYEPIPHRDYYAMMALFTPAYNPQAWVQPHFREGTARKPQYRELPDVALSEQRAIDEHNAQIDRQTADIQAQISALDQSYKDQLTNQKLAGLPEAIRADTKAALETAADKRSEVQKYLAEKLGPLVAVSAEEVSASLSQEDRQKLSGLEAGIAALKSSRRCYGKIQALYDLGPPPATHLLRRGDYQTPGDVVEAGFLSVLSDAVAEPAFDPVAGGLSSGRRLALARWITDSNLPSGGLAARVMVNRIWSQLFGRGIVATPGNFGRSGAAPTHPELLDWLACEFVERGWRVKPMIKLMMMSAAYRQASYRPAGAPTLAVETTGEPSAVAAQSSPEAAADQSGLVDPAVVDPANDLLWKMRLRRLESEIVRDAILATSGKLRRDLGGPPLMLDPRPDGMVVLKLDSLSDAEAAWRRSVYILARRAYHLTLLDVFDQPLVATNCTARTPSAVVTQSLAMLNDAFLFEQADFFAARVAATAGTADTASRIDSAFRLALSRPPGPQELTWSMELVERHASRFISAGSEPRQAEHKALAALCHMLLNTNEFLYIE